MARPPRNDLAVKDFARSIKRVSKAKPTATPKAIELWAYKEHGVHVAPESIRKALAGQVDPTACSIELLTTLAAFYGVEPADLGVYAGRRIASVMSLVGAGGTPPDQGRASTTWLVVADAA